jgi:uncharacterized protein YlxW (UPF0749 family)
MNKFQISILLGIMCMFLSMGIAVQIKTVNDSSTSVGKTQTENALRDSVLRWKEKYESIYNEEVEKEKELANLRNEVSKQDTSSVDLSQELQEANTLLGYSEISGQGIIITLKDATASTVVGNATDYIVHDGDLLEVVNALKNAGAEAISINEQRIVNTTAITCAGNIIKINGEKVGSPFKIKAIGLTEKLNGALTMPGGYLELLEDDGVQVKVEESEDIVIPKYDGIYNFQYAENVE